MQKLVFALFIVGCNKRFSGFSIYPLSFRLTRLNPSAGVIEMKNVLSLGLSLLSIVTLFGGYHSTFALDRGDLIRFDEPAYASEAPTDCVLPLFGSPRHFPNGGHTVRIALADFNNDGHTDIAATAHDNRRVGVFLGDGTGGFTQSVWMAAGDFSVPVAAGDFNGDGNQDLAVGSRDQTVWIYLGQGNGQFNTPQQYYDGNGEAYEIAAADFDLDGKLDLAVGHQFGGLVTLRGNGDGTFSLWNGFLVSQGPVRVLKADFNADGKPDLITSNAHAGTIAILINTGGGGFNTISYTAPYPNANNGFAIGDFDTDGDLDFVATNNDTTLDMYLGDGSGNFVRGQNIYSRNGLAPTAADFDGDGTLDIAVNNGNIDEMSIIIGTGSGTFSAPQVFPTGRGPGYVYTADINHDNRPDIVTPNYYGGDVTVSINNGYNTLDTTAPWIDSAPDITVDSGGTGAANVTYNIAASDNSGVTPTFDCSPQSGSTFALGTTPVTCTAVDACGNRSGSFGFNVTVLCSPVDLSPLNNLSYTATSDNGAIVNYPTINNISSVTYSIPSGSVFPIGQTTVDYTMTQACGNTFSGSFVVTINANPEAEHCDLLSFDYPRYTPSVTGRWLEGLATGDLNSDGHLDLVSNEWADSQVRMHVYFGDGSGNYPTDTPFPWENEGYGLSAIVIADFNNDGKSDIVATGGFSHTLYAYLGDGLGGFSVSQQSFYSSERWTDRLVYGDFDGDGHLDLISRHESRNMYLHRGIGNGYFATPEFIYSNFAPGREYLKVVDLNGDGKADVVFTNTGATSSSENITLMYGNGNGTFGNYQGGSTGNAVDFNFDGQGDRIYAGLVGLRLETGDGTGNYTQVPMNSVTGASQYATDFNGDGLYDIVTFENAGNNNSDWFYPYYEMHFGQPAGDFSAPVRFRNWGDTYACVFGDANEDGRTDLIFSYLGRELAVLLNEGVGDSHAPRIDIPDDITIDAVDPYGTPVDFGVSSRDNSGFSSAVSCDRASGDPFALGSTTVTCTAVDYCGNVGTASFTVTVTDGPPVLNLPTEVPVTATAPTAVTYSATATDAVSGALSVTCLPASGSVFQLGITPVNCSATDPAGNTATGTFNVNVGAVHTGIPSELDTTFNSSPPLYGDVPGVLTNPNGSSSRTMILQPDGKILTGGNDQGGGLSISRFNVNGTPDLSFGSANGKTEGLFPEGSQATVMSLVLQPAGPQNGGETKIIAVGEMANGLSLWGDLWHGKFIIARYNLDGSLDQSFGQSGLTIVDLPDYSRLSGVGIQSDGKIVATGFSGFGSHPAPRSIAIRLLANGAIDNDFGDGGVVSTPFAQDHPWQETWAMFIQPDDKILMAGYFATQTVNIGVENPYDAGLIRLNSDGSLDNSFGSGGKAVFDFGGDISEGYMGLSLQPDGKIVAVGETNFNGIRHTLISRHLTNGTLDTSFGNTGKVILNANNMWLVDLTILPDGKIIALGGGGGNYVLQQYGPDGSLDSTFGANGILSGPPDFIWEEGAEHNWFYSLARQADGRLVVSGSAVTQGAYYNFCWCPVTFLTRYNSNGGTIQLSTSTNSIVESETAATVTVVRTGLISGSDTVTYSTANGTAAAGSDYTAASGTLTFAPGETTKTFTIPIIDDNLREPNETVNIILSNPTNGATLGSQSTAVLTIVNDDQGATRTTVSSVSVTNASSVPLSAIVNDSTSNEPICAGSMIFKVSKNGSIVSTVGPVSCSGSSFNSIVDLTASGTGSYSLFASFGGTSDYLPSSGLGSIAVGSSVVLTPSIGSLVPTSAVAGSGSLEIAVNGSGFSAGASVLWRDPITAIKTSLTVSSHSQTQILATIPSSLLSRADAYQITVDNTPANLTDGESNEQTLFVTAQPVTVTSVTTAAPDPQTNTAAASTSGTSGTVSVSASSTSGSSQGTLTLAQYGSDPIGESTGGGGSTTTFSSTGSYFDVHVSSGSTYNTMTLNFCDTGGNSLYWFDGNSWMTVSPQTFDPQTGCIGATLNNDPQNPSSPMINQLTGTVIAAAGGPVVRSITVTPATPQPANSAFSLSATYADTISGSSYSAIIDWGDGTTTNRSASGGTVSATHAYSLVGVYRPRVKIVRSTDQAFGSASYGQYVVVYDANGGFVTGGGWINSPLGAFSGNPQLTGKSTFGFSSKYLKGATIPTGNTQFTFHSAGMDFSSTAYEWLVVSGARCQYKGSGKINGSGTYRFILTAIDGQVNGGGGIDKFRIKIWDEISGLVIYDNQRGEDDGAALATALGGGSIVVKK